MGENNRDIDRRMVFGDTQKKNPPFPEPELPKEHVVYDFIKSLFDVQQFNLSVESIEETGHTVLEHLDKRSDDTIKKLYKRFDKIFEKFTRRIDDIEELKLAHDYARKQMTELRRQEKLSNRVTEEVGYMVCEWDSIHERLEEMEDGLDLINQKLDTLLRRKR